MTHLLAVETYGKQRVRAPASGAMVSAYKLGYSTLGRAVLLALYGSRALDVTSKQASYHYVSIEGAVCVHQGYLLFALTDDELNSIEKLTRQHPSSRTGCWLWRENQWWRFPTVTQSTYAQITGRDGPQFNPTRFRPVAPQSGIKTDAVTGIIAERSQRTPQDQVWWWLTGGTYPHRELLKQQGCRWSNGRRAWYFRGSELPEAIQQLITDSPSETLSAEIKDNAASCSNETDNAALGTQIEPAALSPQPSQQPEISLNDPSTLVEPTEVQPIRIVKPRPLPSDDSPLDQVQTAIKQAQTQPIIVSPMVFNVQKRTQTPIKQAFAGELTGSITGNVFSYGFATHNDILLYLNFAGPRMAVEAIRAKLSKGEVVSLVPPDTAAIELSAGETDGKANSGMFTTFLQTIPEARFTHAILVHEYLTRPNYLGKSITGIFRISPEQAAAQLLHHVRQLVNIPVFDVWGNFLYQAGQTAGLVRQPRCGGEIDLLVVDLDSDAWCRLITGGLANGVITLPEIPVQAKLS